MTPTPISVLDPPRVGTQPLLLNPLPGAALALTIAAWARVEKSPVLVLTRDPHGAAQLERELASLLAADLPVLHLPDWETLPYEPYSPHAEISSERIAALNALIHAERVVIVVPAGTLMQRLAPRAYLAGSSLVLKRSDKIDLARWRAELEQAGYRLVGQVEEPGEFTVRGAVIDLYPAGSAQPYRVELFDDEVDSIRCFDVDSQRSTTAIDAIKLLPAREFPLTEEAARSFRSRFRERFAVDLKRCSLYQDLRAGATPQGIEYYLPLYFQATETLLDYLRAPPLLVLAPGAGRGLAHSWQQWQERYEARRHDLERPVLAPEELLLPPPELEARLAKLRRVEVLEAADPTRLGLTVAASAAPVLAERGHDYSASLKARLAAGDRVLLCVDSAGRREALLDQLRAADLVAPVHLSIGSYIASGDALGVIVLPLEDGCTLVDKRLLLLTDRQLYGERIRQERRRKRGERDLEAIVRDLSALEVGAPVVHEDHGVGRYLGMETLAIGGEAGEFLVLAYADGDKLYVPVSQLHLLARYSGTADEHAPLHRLGGDQWAKAKKKAASKVNDVAAELLELYARREARQGLAMRLDRSLYEQFVQTFPFEETPDQMQAISAVIADLAAPRPMDRVVCGDVGFGKTEVALRAAFIAVQAGTQVAVLVPTTLLAQQHYQNFRDRFADWPVRVEVLSRFKTASEIKSALQAAREGRVDVLIGTHRLLQDDVGFKQLGLLIIDEEQRFGVRQKEKLKTLRAEVDTLTLTATPIPRTLNLAMSGLRDLSIIATPPEHRLAVKTIVTPWDGPTLREAMLRELNRGGQVYVLHNEVDTIEAAASEIAALMPEARIAVAHGQMAERDLEQVMVDFYRQRTQILVCSTIIENGIDVPTANTILIQRADKLGLGQLHQLRGRVGRSRHRAYAYLIVPEARSISADARKRLDAIAQMDSLGAGFTLATFDLEIRGAGELLGEGQSGQIQEVGYTLYTELLARAVRALKAGQIPDLDAPDQRRGSEISIRVPALIPADYLPDIHHRLTFYKRIASTSDLEALAELKVELIDRCGMLPEPAQALFKQAELKLRATALGIQKLEVGEKSARVVLGPEHRLDPAHLVRLIQREPRRFRLEGGDRLRCEGQFEDPAQRLAAAEELLNRLVYRDAA